MYFPKQQELEGFSGLLEPRKWGVTPQLGGISMKILIVRRDVPYEMLTFAIFLARTTRRRGGLRS